MVQLWRSFGWVLPIVVVGSVVTVGAVAWRVAASPGERREHAERALTSALLAIYGTALALVTLTPGHLPERRPVALVPWGATGIASPLQAVMNLLLLVPLGILIPLRWPTMAHRTRVLLVVAVPIAIELAQFALGVSRVASTSDALLNALGGLLGLGLVAVVRRVSASRP